MLGRYVSVVLVAGVLWGCSGESNDGSFNGVKGLGGTSGKRAGLGGLSWNESGSSSAVAASGGTVSSSGGAALADTVSNAGRATSGGTDFVNGGATSGAAPSTFAGASGGRRPIVILSKPGSGGGVVAAGSTGGGAGLAGASGNRDTTQCVKAWPRSQVLPTVGIFFFGSDPGPCTQTAPTQTGVNRSTYSYQDGRLASITYGGTIRTFKWDQELLNTVEWVTNSAVVLSLQYTWASDSVTETVTTGEVRKYYFSSTGYPTEVWVSTAALSPYVAVRYEYSDCRLVRRVVLSSDGTVDDLTTSVFEYDADGHIIKQRFGSTHVETFDYSCW